uniref:Uncharacterized protein n=1 Tax=Glossina brevipalpis TaxID=37001 RepID=A0A1A9WVT7_9MUSC
MIKESAKKSWSQRTHLKITKLIDEIQHYQQGSVNKHRICRFKCGRNRHENLSHPPSQSIPSENLLDLIAAIASLNNINNKRTEQQRQTVEAISISTTSLSLFAEVVVVLVVVVFPSCLTNAMHIVGASILSEKRLHEPYNREILIPATPPICISSY